jgi:PTS system galactitol-specific IIA component
VGPDYGAQTLLREEKHPTGLPTAPFCIAFPHADAEGVNRSALALAVLRRPVIFRNMADPDEELEVHLVLMLANKSPQEQIRTLRNLAILFGEPEKLAALRSQPTPASAAAWLRQELNLSQPSEPLANP